MTKYYSLYDGVYPHCFYRGNCDGFACDRCSDYGFRLEDINEYSQTVEIVRCSECHWGKKLSCEEERWCRKNGKTMSSDGFCSEGKDKDELD